MATSIRVLCVDDEPDLAELVATYLMDHADDIEAMTATDGGEALSVTQREEIDCIVCDYKMPDMTGLELLEEVHTDTPELPFILFTGKGDEDVASKAVRAGVSDYIPKSTGTEQYELLSNRVRNLVERDRARTTTRELFNAATDAILVHDADSGEIIDANDAACVLWKLNRADLIGDMPESLCVGTDIPGDTWLEDRPVDNIQPVDLRCLRSDGSTFWAEIRVQNARIDGKERLLSLCRDITRRKHRENRLSLLLEAANDIVGARDFTEIGTVVTETMTETLGFDGAMLYVEHAAGERLTSVSSTGELGPDSTALQDRAQRLLTDSAAPTKLSDGGTTLKPPDPATEGEVMFWPLGERAMLVGRPGEDISTGFAADLVDLLLAVATTAIMRTFRERELEYQHEELESLNHINEVIRDINQTLVKVSTPDEIETLVCQQLSVATPFLCTWIGEHDITNEEVRSRLAVGRGAEELEDEEISTDAESTDPLSGPMRRVIEERAVVTVDELTPTTVGNARADHAETNGFESLTFVPITYQNVLYNILGIYAAEKTPFGDEQQEVLRELGDTIGYAMHTAERSRALLSDTTIELEYEIRDKSSVLTGLSAVLKGEVHLERIFFKSDDSARLFLNVGSTDFETVESYIKEKYEEPASVRTISNRDGDLVVEVSLTELPMMTHLADDMARIRSAMADNGEGRLVIEIPNTASVRTLTENLELVFDDVSMLARRQREREVNSFGGADEHEKLGLTNRQYEVLLTAYHAGFFSWPRESTGEEIATLLDISQPTFHEHLRTGERKVLERLFENRRSIYT